MRRKYKHSNIVKEIAKELDMHPKVVHLIIKNFFNGLRKLISRNEEINIKGFFILKLGPHYKKRVKKEGKNINLRKRKEKKYDYVKKPKN